MVSKPAWMVHTILGIVLKPLRKQRNDCGSDPNRGKNIYTKEWSCILNRVLENARFKLVMTIVEALLMDAGPESTVWLSPHGMYADRGLIEYLADQSETIWRSN